MDERESEESEGKDDYDSGADYADSDQGEEGGGEGVEESGEEGVEEGRRVESSAAAAPPESRPSGAHRLALRVTISDCGSEVFCVRFSPDGRLLAAGGADGAVRLFSARDGSTAYTLQGGSGAALPTTSIRFRPPGPAVATKNVLIASNAAGTVQHWHVTSGKCLHTIDDPSNQVYALDYAADGSKFVTAGGDKCVRVYDEATKTAVAEMRQGIGYSATATPGHSNRVFAAKFVPFDDNLVVTGGWDNSVIVWDSRAGRAVRSIYGPHLCGDALDVAGQEIVTGSWRPENQLEIWDFRSGNKITEIPWLASTAHGQSACLLYAAQFSRDGRFVGAGGSGANEAKVFDHSSGNALVGTVANMHRGVFALDFSPDGSKVAVAGGDSSIRILDIVRADA